MANLIILKNTFGKVGIKCFLCTARDPKTGQYPACVKQVNSAGDLLLTDAERNDGKVYIPVNRTVIVEDGTTYDLDDPYQKAEWESIQFSPAIALSRDQRDVSGNLVIDGGAKRYGIAELYVERPDYVIEKKVNKRKLIHTAEDYIFNDPKGVEGRAFMAKLMGKSTRGVADADIQGYLLDIAKEDPNKIINLYRSDDISLRLLFIDAKDKFVIYVKNGLYLYGDGQTMLGATDDAAIEWMRRPSNSRIVELMRRDTYPEMYSEKVAAEKILKPEPEKVVKTISEKDKK